MNSADLRKYRSSIVMAINSVEVPCEIKRLVVSDILSEIEKITTEEINYLLAQRQESEEESDEQSV